MLIKCESHTVHVDMLGNPDDPVVCFLHPLAADSGMWAAQIPAMLASGFRCLRIDFRGHGGTAFGNDPVTLDTLVDDVRHVVETLQVGRVHVVGLSVGGVVAQGLSAKYGHLVESMVLSDCLAESLPEGVAAWKARQAAAQKAGGLESMADLMLSKWVNERLRSENPPAWQALRSTLAATSVEGFVAIAEIMQHFSFVQSLPTVTCPSLVLCGENDELSPPAQVRRIAELIPHARFELIPGGRHFSNVDEAKRFNRVLCGWLAGLSKAQP